jgi:PhnB protein
MATRGKGGKAKRQVMKSRATQRTTKRTATKGRAKAVPAGFQTVNAHIVQDDCARAIEFYKKAFGAKEGLRMPGPGGKIVHAEVVIGSSRLMMSDEMDPMPGQPGVYKSPKSAGLNTAALFLYVPNVDKWFDRAVQAGCTVRSPLVDMFWGDRFGQVIDPFGHTWGMATHTDDVSPAEMRRRQQDFFAKMSAGDR